MRKVSLLLIVAAAAAASFSKPAVAFEPERDQDKAAEVLANMRKAIGDGKLDTLKTFSLEAKMARNVGDRQMTSDIELFLEIPDKYLRVENVTAPTPRTMTSGFNGDKVIRPAMTGGAGGPMVIMNGVAMGGGGGGQMVVTTRAAVEGAAGRGGAPGTPPTPEQQAMMNNAMLRNQRVELSRYMLGWFGMAHPGLNATYTYAGEAEAPDGKAHVIDIKADGGFAVKLFVDQATNLPLMLTYVLQERNLTQAPPAAAPAGDAHTAHAAPPPGSSVVVHGAPPPPPPPPPPAAQGAAPRPQMTPEEAQKQLDAIRNTPLTPVEYRIFFSDWKEVDGVQFPHVLQRARLGNTTEEWTISKVKVNPKIDAKKFSTQ
jgi:hypothetical protein